MPKKSGQLGKLQQIEEILDKCRNALKNGDIFIPLYSFCMLHKLRKQIHKKEL